MRKVTVGFLFSLCLASFCQAAFVDQWDVPAWSGTTVGSSDGNPYVDADGNTWGAYQVTFGEYLNPVSYDSAHAMQWTQIGASTLWYGPNGGGEVPQYNSDKALVGMNGGTYAAALRFTPDQAGEYSWTGMIPGTNYGGGSVYMVFAKLTSTAGTLLTDIHVYNGSPLDLDSVAALQNQTLEVGDSLVLVVTSPNSYSIAVADLSSAGIGYVPEPTTLGLLGMGILFLRRKRK